MKKIRAVFRLLYFVAYTLLRVGQIVASSLLLGENMRRSMRIRKSWAEHLLPAIGVRASVSGRPPGFPCLLMGNHRSYLDPAIILLHTHAYPVSKAEVANWPLIGYGAKVSGVLFLKRESQASRKFTLQAIADKIKEGFPVILFPEGTTHSEPLTVDFRLGGFKLAAENNVPVVPLAIKYASPLDHWTGNDTFLSHFLRRFGEKHMAVKLCYGEPLTDTDPERLMAKTKKWIDEKLIEL
jgi:1-acyl-sn-glycerol-3-phosphate acyltransferase